jgi:hypothetical protein
LAFLLRRVGAAQLDVQELELTAGLYSGTVSQLPTTFAFIADTLENGAGFSTHLGEEAPLEKLLDGANAYIHELASPSHADDCSASCYKCLRDYSNMAYHALLDWRLAGDLLAILMGHGLNADNAREESAVAKWAEGYNAAVVDGMPASAAVIDHPIYGRCGVIGKHPLEASEKTVIAPRLSEAQAELEVREPGLDSIVFADTFLLDRDPGRVMVMLDEADGSGLV